MKKIFLVAALFSATTFAFAQTKTTEAYSAVEASRAMSENLQLNEGQYLQIKALNNVKQERYLDIDALYANDPEMRQQKLDALNAEMDAEYQKVLKPDQYQTYLELEGRSTASSEVMGSDMVTPQSDQMNMGESDADVSGSDQTEPATGTRTEMKVKSGQDKIKAEPGKMKVETSKTEAKTKSSDSETKSKMKRADGSEVKEESDKNHYKYQDSKDNSKVKAKDDKLKVEDKNGKIKVEDDKVKIKSRD